MPPIDHSPSETLEMFEIVEGVKDSVPMSAQIRGWAHAVKKQRIIALVFVRIVLVFRGVNGNVRSAAAIKFREKQTEPVGMFVVNGDWLRCGHVGLLALMISPLPLGEGWGEGLRRVSRDVIHVPRR